MICKNAGGETMEENRISTQTYEAAAKDTSFLGIKRTELLIGLKEGDALSAVRACIDPYRSNNDIITAEVWRYDGEKTMTEKLMLAQWVSEQLDSIRLKPYETTDGSGLYWNEIVPKIDYGYYAASRGVGYSQVLIEALVDIIRTASRNVVYLIKSAGKREQ